MQLAPHMVQRTAQRDLAQPGQACSRFGLNLPGSKLYRSAKGMAMEPETHPTARGIVVMGVSGAGKSTLGARLALALGYPFLDGDDYHTAANVAKMHAGGALTDADRWPWLDRLGLVLGDAVRARGGAVVACSALKRVYRDRIARGAGVPVRFVLLDADPAELQRRLAARRGHFMAPGLLSSQLDTLERPGADEPAATFDAAAAPDDLLRRVQAWLAA
jgi:gluconokinase